MHAPRRRTRLLAAAATAAIGVGTVGITAFAAAPAQAADRTEQVLVTHSPVRDVVVSQVTIKAPLPTSVGTHPAACDDLTYLRYRHARGPASSAAAAKILLTQPGALAGASSLDSIARNTITDAAASGSYIEFWALDRRANCLEDNSGLTAAVAANDPKVALDYYTKGTRVNGKKFAGYVPDSKLGWLQNMGMQQTVEDEYTLLTRELPDPAVRASKVWCGGHSLGGVVTAFFTMSDFDGNQATKGDAGYNQCAGYFALDTQISTSIGGGTAATPIPDTVPGLVKAGRGAVDAALASGILPRSLNFPVVNPETTNLLGLAGVYAQLRPNEVSPLAGAFKDNDNVSLALRTLLSKDAVAFLTGSPTFDRFRVTNEAALGLLLDDDSMPLAVLQESVGFLTGGAIADKSFPTPNDLLKNEDLKGFTQTLLGTEKKAIPTDTGSLLKPPPLYTWLNYDEVAPGGTNVAKAADGTPFTTAAKENTDIGELARSLGEFPLDFTEHYFPLKMMTDTSLWAAGDRTVVPTAVYAEGPTARPTLNLLAGDGLVIGGFKGKPLPANTLVLPGYQHLDVLTAAPVQNDGTPEKGAAALSAFVLGR